ncbi:MAG TPA: ABC transporter permease [Chlamydiales bacterium]|nr:ABC transporter permease [Chlamydiales bacterium]
MDKQLKFAFFLLLIFILFSLFGPLLTPHSPYDIHLELRNLPPCSQFWFGSDELGRDVFARVSFGTRLSLFVALFAAFIDLFIGVLLGSLAAFLGGAMEEAMIRFFDILQAIPHLLVVILLTVIRGSGMETILIAMGTTCWIHTARITRAQLVQIKTLDYIRGARSIGASSPYIITHYMIPNAIGPILAAVTLTFPSAIFTEAFLSFLGLGVQAPEASLGILVSDGLSAIRYYPWRLWIPSSVISLLLFSFHWIGNGLRDHLDPRIR